MFSLNNFKKENKGYVAVVSAVIISTVVILLALVFSNSNFLGRFDTNFLERKEVSRGVAEGCLEYARLKLAAGSYGGNEVIAISSYQCTILPIESPSGQKIIKTTASVNNQITNLKLTVDAQTLKTISLEELDML